jgi:hypothetical protein
VHLTAPNSEDPDALQVVQQPSKDQECLYFFLRLYVED